MGQLDNQDKIKRKYIITKISVGDYLLPDNDGCTLWRLRKYEDGVSYGLEQYDHDFTRWSLYRYARHLSADTGPYSLDAVDLDDQNEWVLIATDFLMREDAINEAFRISRRENRAGL